MHSVSKKGRRNHLAANLNHAHLRQLTFSFSFRNLSFFCRLLLRRAPVWRWATVLPGGCQHSFSVARLALAEPTSPWYWERWSWIACGVTLSHILSKNLAQRRENGTQNFIMSSARKGASGPTAPSIQGFFHLVISYFKCCLLFLFIPALPCFPELRAQQPQNPNHCSRSSRL